MFVFDPNNELNPDVTIDEFLAFYVEMYGKNKWALSTYRSKVALIRHYISPFIGSMRVKSLTTFMVEKYYNQLKQSAAVARVSFNRAQRMNGDVKVSENTIMCIHKLLRSAMNQAIKWGVIDRNPCEFAEVPRKAQNSRQIWDIQTLNRALALCEEDKLALAMNLAFCCTLRVGELLGLTWDCVDIDPKVIAEGRACIRIEKELQRVGRSVLSTLDKKDVLAEFEPLRKDTSSVLVLKRTKTESSERTVYVPRSLAEMLARYKDRQMKENRLKKGKYSHVGLVFTRSCETGYPLENAALNTMFQNFVAKNNLPRVVFYSLRHTSITYKLMLSKGDIKAVQGDSGHAQAKMVTDQYSHILDETRRRNAVLMEEFFYGKSEETCGNVHEEPRKSEDCGQKCKTVEPDFEADNSASPMDSYSILLTLVKDPEALAALQLLNEKLQSRGAMV